AVSVLEQTSRYKIWYVPHPTQVALRGISYKVRAVRPDTRLRSLCTFRGFIPAKLQAVKMGWGPSRSVTMNWRQQRNNRVRGLLLSLLLCAIPASSAAQQKKPPAPAPTKPEAPPPKPAAAPKPAETPKPEPKPAPKPEPRPATSGTAHPSTAPHTNTTGSTRPGASVQPRAGTPNGARNGGPAGARTNGTAPAAKAEPERVYQPPVVVARPGGGKISTNAAGHSTEYNPAGKKTTFETKSGTKANCDHNGYIRTIHTRSGMTINHGSHGERRYESRRPDGGRIVGFGHGRGFAEHVYYRGGHPFMRRTYFYNGHRYAYAYRGYYWHGHPYYGYVPPYYYAPGFYGWAYNPWAAPVAFGWGWGGAPWYGYYGYYFNPFPVYASPAFWITDYLLAANLQAAYEARAAAQANANANANAEAAAEEQPASGGGPVALSPEVKQQIADEVRAQIAAQQQQAEHPEPAAPVSSTAPAGGGQTGPDEVPAALDPARRTFIVSAVLSESTPDGTECSLSPGDVLTRIQDTPD